ncbi:MAG: TRAP transporter fused permease subunit [Dehalococcoidales bacterium]|nr:TRAP transporter fused permease subunit [Dehalococcoidales bacterium]
MNPHGEATPSNKGQQQKRALPNALFALALVFALFQLIVPVFINMVDLQLKAIHIVLGLSTGILAFSLSRGERRLSVLNWALIVIILAANLNIFLNWYHIYLFPGDGTLEDWILGILLIIALLESTRRATGPVLPAFVLLLVAYVFLGRFLPDPWGHAGFSLKFVIGSVYYSPLGIYGAITGYSATFISILIIFGALLLVSGGGKTFIDVALILGGRFRGGPAKIAVIASALFGTISGAPVANVMVVGTYTIPLMRRLGYPPYFAAGVEAMASTGGIITPPIMGVTAFIMAELIGVPYIKICGYAVIPAILYYVGVFTGVHAEALRMGLAPMPKEEIPKWRGILTWQRLVPLIAPLVALMLLLLKGFSLTTAGFYASLITVVLYFLIDLRLSAIKSRVFGIAKALEDGAKTMAILVPLMVTANIALNLLGITGVAPKVSELVMGMGGTFLAGSIIVGGIVPLLLGMFVPPAAAYLLSAALVAPALVQLGLGIIPVHMFLFYLSALAVVTPPDCLAVFAAATIARTGWVRVSFVTIRLGVVAFLMPFLFIVNPSLLAIGNPVDIIARFILGFGGAILIGCGLFGYFLSPINVFTRLAYVGSGLLLFLPDYRLSLLGLGMAAVISGSQLLFRKLRTRPVAG